MRGFGFNIGPEYDNGNSGASITINWSQGTKQRVRLTNTCTFTFTPPPSPQTLVLVVVQDGVGNRTATWPASVLWENGLPPALSTGAGQVDVFSLYYDGTNYHGSLSIGNSS